MGVHLITTTSCAKLRYWQRISRRPHRKVEEYQALPKTHRARKTMIARGAWQQRPAARTPPSPFLRNEAAANPMPTSLRTRPSHQTRRRSVKPSWHRSTVGREPPAPPLPAGKIDLVVANIRCFLDRTHAREKRLADSNHAFKQHAMPMLRSSSPCNLPMVHPCPSHARAADIRG